MQRREFITLLGSAAAAWPLVARAQQSQRMRRIGVLMQYTENDPDSQARRAGLEADLARLGWMIGRNLAIDYRWNNLTVIQARAAAAELLALAPDVILANTFPGVQALFAATRTVPVVFTFITLPAAQGWIESQAHPGGNMTGFTYLEPPIAGKWLDLLKEIAPRVTRVAYIFNPPAGAYAGLFYGSIEPSAARFGIETALVAVNEPADFERAIAAHAREPGGGMIIDPDSFTSLHRRLIIDLAARYHLPAIYSRRFFTADGGLASYGVDDNDHFRQVASYLDRILRGEKPADMPVQQPTKFELLINKKTAEALGLGLPTTLLARADELIE